MSFEYWVWPMSKSIELIKIKIKKQPLQNYFRPIEEQVKIPLEFKIWILALQTEPIVLKKGKNSHFIFLCSSNDFLQKLIETNLNQLKKFCQTWIEITCIIQKQAYISRNIVTKDHQITPKLSFFWKNKPYFVSVSVIRGNYKEKHDIVWVNSKHKILNWKQYD